jgi:oligoendopeptidase F
MFYIRFNQSMKHKTDWNLKLLYENEQDPQIERDVKSIARAVNLFAKKYQNKPFTKNPKALTEAIMSYMKFADKLRINKAWGYYTLRKDINSDDDIAQAKATKYAQEIAAISNKTTFFFLEISKIPVEKQKSFLVYPGLKLYVYLLQRVFDNARNNLSEKEEQLVELLDQPAVSMWIGATEKALNRETVFHNRKTIPLSEAVGITAGKPKKERRELYKKTLEVFKKNAPFAEAEINAVYNFKKIIDTRRGFAKPYSSTVLYNQNTEKSIELLIDTVSKQFKIAHRFYRLHAKLL